MEVTQVFDSSHCLLPLVKDKMFRKVDLLTSESKTKNKVFNSLRLLHSIELVKDTSYLKRRDRYEQVV
jgi:hypothetical protein